MITLSSLLERNLTEVFNQRNGTKRLAALRAVWALNGILWSAEGTYVGLREVGKAAADLLRRFPEFQFTPVGVVDEIPEAARMRLSFGVSGSSPALTGLDVVTARDGKIVQLYRFLDGANL